MALSFTSIVPTDGALVSRYGTMMFTLSSDVRDGQGVRVGIYSVATDTEEVVWNGALFVGKYASGSTKVGDDFVVRRHGGWPPGGVALRVQELGSVEVVTIWTDGTGAPSNSVGENGDYYLDTATGDIYKKASGTYSLIFSPVIANGSITNAKLANMATQTIKGRTTAGAGAPEDLSATQATAILNAFTGDSGSGGLKGLVPAPSAGDAAAGKVLSAAGGWTTVNAGATEYWAIIQSTRGINSGGGPMFSPGTLTLPAGLYEWVMIVSLNMGTSLSRSIIMKPNFNVVTVSGFSVALSSAGAVLGLEEVNYATSLAARSAMLHGTVYSPASFTATPFIDNSGTESVTVFNGSYFRVRRLSSTHNQVTNGTWA